MIAKATNAISTTSAHYACSPPSFGMCWRITCAPLRNVSGSWGQRGDGNIERGMSYRHA